MREIKFRGTAVIEEDDSIELTDRIIKHGDWVYGNLIFTENGTPYIVGELVEVDVDYTVLHYWIPVDNVGQYTGLKDKNGVEIYEGDILSDGDLSTRVHWNYTEAGFTNGVCDWRELLPHLEVIGNVHESK